MMMVMMMTRMRISMTMFGMIMLVTMMNHV